MGRPLPSAVCSGLTVVVALVSGCAARPSNVALTERLVRGADGPGGIEWPAAPEAPAPADAAPVVLAPELAAGPRARYEVRDAATLESTDARLQALLAAVETRPTVASRLAAAAAYRRLGVFDQAHALLADALEDEPRNPQILDALARLWRDWGVAGQALPIAYRALAAEPRSPDVVNTLGTTLFALGHVAAAAERFDEVLRLDASAAYAHSNLCYVALTEGDEARATRHCEAALAMDPGHRAARNNLALVHAMAGRWDAAAEAFERAADDAGVARFNLGVALLAQREYGRAAAILEEVADRRPDLRQARIRAREARRLAAAEPAAGGGNQ